MRLLVHTRARRRALALAAMLSLGSSPTRAGAADLAGLRPGVFLYASPALREANFAETVVLLIQHDAAGAMGLIVNRPTETAAQQALAEAALAGVLVYEGGPVQPEAMLALVRAREPPKDGVRVLDGVFLTTRSRDLAAAARGGRAVDRVRVYSGYSGWGAGQLEKEIQLGAWVIGRAEAAWIFSPEPRTLWRRVFQLLQRREA